MAGKMVLYKLVVLGDGGVGKTAMTIQLTLQHFVETYDPTIEDSYRKQVVIDDQSCMLEVLDTAGQEEYTALRDQWIRDGEGFVLMYSICSRESFNRIVRFHNQIQRVKESAASSPSYPGALINTGVPSAPVPICLIGNKSDRVTEREVSTQEGHALAMELGCDFLECSAKNCLNVEKAFYDVVRQLRRQRTQSSLYVANPRNAHPMDGRYRRYRTTERSWWRKFIPIPPTEEITDAGRKTLTVDLVHAAKSNRERKVIAFLGAGANVNGQPGSDGAAIHAASAFGHANIVNILLKKGAAINARGPSGASPLQVAAAEGHLAVIRLLLHKGAQIDQVSQLHGSALSAAASRGRVEVVQHLLKKGADVNVVGGPYGNALQAAAWMGNAVIVEALLGAGADINARGQGDCTALQMAAFAGNTNVIKSLLELGGTINIDAPGGKYGCALQAADDQGHFEAVIILLEAGATKTLKTPTETPSTDEVDNGGEVEQPEPTQVVSDAATSPTPASGWPLNSSTANLVNLPTPALVDDQSQCSTSRPDERPQINMVGFSCISNPERPTFDIVFVHGLQGHAEKTWTHQPPAAAKKRFFHSSTSNLSQPPQHSVFWPYDLLSKHPEFSQARILTWGYESKIIAEFFGTSDQQNISQHGNDLMVALQQERKREPARPLIFVAHSLGGILVKVVWILRGCLLDNKLTKLHALDNSKRSTHQPQYLPIYDSTTAIIFLGTPHGGSTSTNWGLLTSNLTKFALQAPSERIIKGLKPNSELLENLRKVFLQMLEDNTFNIHTFYETKSMLGMYGLNDRVVPYNSALVGHARREIVRGINGNHSEICKFSGDSDPGYRAVLGALEDYITASRRD